MAYGTITNDSSRSYQIYVTVGTVGLLLAVQDATGDDSEANVDTAVQTLIDTLAAASLTIVSAHKNYSGMQPITVT